MESPTRPPPLLFIFRVAVDPLAHRLWLRLGNQEGRGGWGRPPHFLGFCVGLCRVAVPLKVLWVGTPCTPPSPEMVTALFTGSVKAGGEKWEQLPSPAWRAEVVGNVGRDPGFSQFPETASTFRNSPFVKLFSVMKWRAFCFLQCLAGTRDQGTCLRIQALPFCSCGAGDKLPNRLSAEGLEYHPSLYSQQASQRALDVAS